MFHPRVTAPLTVLGKPLVAEIEAFFKRTAAGGIATADVRLRVRFLRDRHGNSRMDYYDSFSATSPPVAAVLWSPVDHIITQVSYSQRHVDRGKDPLSPSETHWLPRGRFVFKFADDALEIHTLPCKRVNLVFSGAQPDAVQRDEIWVAPDWGLVLRDVLVTSNHESRWEVVHLERSEPEAGSLRFDVPIGFTVNE